MHTENLCTVHGIHTALCRNRVYCSVRYVPVRGAVMSSKRGSVGMLTFSGSNLKTSPYHYPHKLVLFRSRYTVSCIYCEYFNLSCFVRPSVFDLQIKKLFSGFSGFYIDDLTWFFTLAGNVFQHIWQSFSFSAPSHNRFYDTLHFPGLFLPTCLCLHLSLSFCDSVAGGLPAHIMQTRCTLTEQRASLWTRAAVLMRGYLCADAPSKCQCDIKRALGGRTAKSNSHHLATGFWFCYWALRFLPFIFLEAAVSCM